MQSDTIQLDIRSFGTLYVTVQIAISECEEARNDNDHANKTWANKGDIDHMFDAFSYSAHFRRARSAS